MMFDIVKTNVGKALPAQQTELQNQIYADLEKQLDGIIPQILDVSVRAYAENYTEQEMRDLIAFNSSESGRSIKAKAPAVRAQALNETMPLIMGVVPQIARKAADHVCDVNHCSAEQRETIAAAVAKAVPGPPS